jgi:alpha-L-fucosidase 2
MKHCIRSVRSPASGIFLALLFTAAIAVAADLVLWYDRPAKKWESEALPIGNGRIGGMFFGQPDSERVQFNDNSLWTGDENPSGVYESMGGYQAFGDVRVRMPAHTNFTGYRRELDLSEAAGRVRYVKDGVTFSREFFASHPDEVMVFRFTADKPRSHSGTVELSDMHRAPVMIDGGALVVTGALSNGMKFASRVVVLNEGGTVSAKDGRIEFAECDSLTVLLGVGTDYVMDYARRYRGDAALPRVKAQMDAAAKKGHATLRAAHMADYQALFNRVALDLGSPAGAGQLTTAARLKAYAGGAADTGLESLFFQFGRYLLISCSRHALPANLQGLWNDSNNAAWHSDYHANINVQMNYWGVEVANLAECHRPFFNLIQSQLEPWRKATAAAKEYQTAKGPVRGWALRTSHNITGGLGWQWDKTANAWYCQHLWEHYAYSGDKEFLRKTAYPIMKEVCEFWEDQLKALPDGRLVVPKGWSPEHGPHEDGVSYSQEIVWDLFNNYAQASEALGIDADYRAKVTAMRDKLVTPKIGRWGQLQEWMPDRDDPKDQHRHTSHLFAVYPGVQISRARTPELAKAAAVSLEARGTAGDSRRSWTWPWRCALWARLGEPEKAHAMIRGLFTYNMLPNLYATHPPFQMDGNFGYVGAIGEMLVQSHAGEIQLLPALPKAWAAAGSVKGLRARGGFEVALEWKDGRLTAARLLSTRGGSCKVTHGGKTVTVQTAAGQTTDVTAQLVK